MSAKIGNGDQKPQVCVVGLGYIGLPTAAIIARSGCPVLGLDVTQSVVDTINRGEIHIEEVDLDGLVQGVVQRGLLRASVQIEPADVFVIAVPTPFAKDGHHTPDVSYVQAAASEVAGVLKSGDVVILESTSPVGTTEMMRDLMAGLRPDLKFPGLTRETPDVSIAYCPERVLPGRILEELTNNDRSIGGISPRCARKALAFYKRFVRGTCVTTDARSAEMTKLVENAYRDVNIAFANELSIVADRMGLDVWEVIRLANRHPRVNILQPGPGVGGHCIAVDPWFIVASAPEHTPLIRAARGVNDLKMHHVIERATALIDAHPTRESPASASPSRLTSTTSARVRRVSWRPGLRASMATGSRSSSPMPLRYPSNSRTLAPPSSISMTRWRLATCWSCWLIMTCSRSCRLPSAMARWSTIRAGSGLTSRKPRAPEPHCVSPAEPGRVM